MRNADFSPLLHGISLQGPDPRPDLPLCFATLRHGEFDGNLNHSGEAGLVNLFDYESDMTLGLNEKGRQQIKMVRQALIQNGLLASFDSYFTSPFQRTVETAEILLPDIAVPQIYAISERSRGDVRELTKEQFESQYPKSAAKKVASSATWLPPGGERIQTCGEAFIEFLPRTQGKFPLFVTHGEFKWGIRFKLGFVDDKRMTQIINLKNDETLVIHNGQLDIWSRIDLWSGTIRPTFSFMQTVAPAFPEIRGSGWIEIQSPVDIPPYKSAVFSIA